MREPSQRERAAVEVLRTAASVVLCAHVGPDGDAIGSTLALTLALRAAGIRAVPTLAEGCDAPPTYAYLPGFSEYRPACTLEVPDVFIALDSPSLPRLGDAAPLAQAAAHTIDLDHHADNHHFGDIDLVDGRAASTGTLVWRLLPALGVPPTPEIAANCYVALMTDTGRFSYANTTAETLRDAAEMIDAGADAARLYSCAYERRSASSLALLGRALSRITIANGGRVAYSWITQADLTETGAAPEETENLVDTVRQTGGVDAVAFFKENGEGTKVSLRAKCPTLDVATVAHAFDGGGHRGAAGASVPAPLEDAITQVLALLPGAGA
jgi:bifunctional oligoribonuclease and PAP phosphatase NrnA